MYLTKKLKKLEAKKEYDNDQARKRYISRIILKTMTILASTKAAIVLYHLIFLKLGDYYKGSVSLLTIMIILSLSLILYFIFYLGHERFVSYTLIFAIFLMATYLSFTWGADLPAGILLYILAIVISGILIGSTFSFITTAVITIIITIIGCLQKNQIASVDRSWIYNNWDYSDILLTAIILFIIAIVLWLFHQELKNEKNLLKIKIAEKTKELKIAQAKEMAQFYRFAEFGKLSGGLFHDLANPLTAVMLNISKAKMDSELLPNAILIKEEINQALKASEKMKNLITSVRKQINFQDQQEIFSLNKEIEEAMAILNYKAQKNQTEIFFEADENIVIKGNPIKFNQVVTNLLSNAIDSFDNYRTGERGVIIILSQLKDNIELKIIDNGKGMDEKLIKQIFEPFFTTKNNGDGLGLGLSIIKKIVEESFLGKISVRSKVNHGSTFIINIPPGKI